MKIIKNYRLQFSKIISNYNDYLYSISLILNYMTKEKTIFIFPFSLFNFNRFSIWIVLFNLF